MTLTLSSSHNCRGIARLQSMRFNAESRLRLCRRSEYVTLLIVFTSVLRRFRACAFRTRKLLSHRSALRSARNVGFRRVNERVKCARSTWDRLWTGRCRLGPRIPSIEAFRPRRARCWFYSEPSFRANSAYVFRAIDFTNFSSTAIGETKMTK